MPFPTSIQGKLSIKRVNVDAVMNGVEGALREQKATAVRRDGYRLTFGRMQKFRVAPVRYGCVELDAGALDFLLTGQEIRLSYHVSVKRGLIFITVGCAVIFGLMPWIGDGWSDRLPGRMIFSWLLFFGLYYGLTWWRFAQFLRKAAEGRL